MRIYLDACCFNRPFDDQTQERIQFETSAIIIILNHVRLGTFKLLGSDVLHFEIYKTPDPYRKAKLRILASYFTEKIEMNEEIINRATELQDSSFQGIDAFHLACAEICHADAFLTTDDGIIKKSMKLKNPIKLKVQNPIEWLQEYLEK